MTDKERMIAGKLYNPLNKKLLAERIHARMLADRFNRTHAWNFPRRTRLIRRIFKNAKGKMPFFEPPIRVEYGYNVTFGDNFYMNYNCMLLDVSPIEIGNDVMFGPNVTIATPMHPLWAEERIAHDYPDGNHDLEYSKAVKIGNGVWIASGATVCGGVTIGDGAVIAAGSVVTRDVPPNVLAGGVPCRVIRELTESDRMHPWETYLKDGE